MSTHKVYVYAYKVDVGEITLIRSFAQVSTKTTVKVEGENAKRIHKTWDQFLGIYC